MLRPALSPVHTPILSACFEAVAGVGMHVEEDEREEAIDKQSVHKLYWNSIAITSTNTHVSADGREDVREHRPRQRRGPIISQQGSEARFARPGDGTLGEDDYGPTDALVGYRRIHASMMVAEASGISVSRGEGRRGMRTWRGVDRGDETEVPSRQS